MEEIANFGTADAYWNNKFQKQNKNISPLFHNVCISIDEQFQGKSFICNIYGF
jgi:hypothetical protein